MEKQKTIAKETTIRGIGLHSGNKITVTLRPAPEDAGVVFFRTDLPGKPAVKASVETICPKTGSMRCSYIDKDGVQVTTTEHFLAALCGLGVDNIYVEVDAEELPGMDGSSLDFLSALKAAGLKEQEKEREYLTIREPVVVEEGGAFIAVFPAAEFKISYSLDYAHPFIGSGFYQISVTPDTFTMELAGARTFCLEEEVEQLRKQGLGKGANYDNTLVVGDNGVIGNKLRFPNEFIRHKMLDLLGDLYILGKPIRGRIIAAKSGHSLNLKFVKKLGAQLSRRKIAVPASTGHTGGGSVLDINQIMGILPHRQPFLFIDRILELEQGKRCVGIKNVTINDYFFEGHFPGQPVMPGVIILEAMAQVGGVMMLSTDENRGKIAFFMSINNAKFRKPVLPGDQIVFEVFAEKVKSRTGQIRGTACVDGKLVCEADLMFALGEQP